MTVVQLRSFLRLVVAPRYGWRVTTQAEREAVAARSRELRAVGTILVFLLVPLATIAALHLWFTPGDDVRPMELS